MERRCTCKRTIEKEAEDWRQQNRETPAKKTLTHGKEMKKSLKKPKAWLTKHLSRMSEGSQSLSRRHLWKFNDEMLIWDSATIWHGAKLCRRCWKTWILSAWKAPMAFAKGLYVKCDAISSFLEAPIGLKGGHNHAVRDWDDFIFLKNVVWMPGSMAALNKLRKSMETTKNLEADKSNSWLRCSSFI